MSDYGWGMFKKGLKRRKKEVRRMRVMTCLAVFFLVFTLLFQDNINAFLLQINYAHHGRWVLETHGEPPDNTAFYNDPVTVRAGSEIYRLYPKLDESDVIEKIEYDEYGEEVLIYKPLKDENGDWLPLEDEITVDALGMKRNTNVHIGTMPAEFAERNGIELYEGHMPEKPDEIAAELQVLQRLGLSYELGQTVEFYAARKHAMPGDEEWDEMLFKYNRHPPESEYMIELYLVSFKLVGTIKGFTSNWGADTLPNAFITDEAYDAMDMRKRSGDFYEFKQEYVTSEVRGLAETMFEACAERTDVLTNTQTYTDTVWGNMNAYRAVTAVLMLLSSSVIAYLMASYLGDRRSYFLSMREIGATTREVFLMAGYECVLSVLPGAAITLAAACAAAALISLAVSLALRLPYVFVFRPSTLLLITAACIATILIAFVSAFAVFAGKGLREKKKTVGKSAAKSIRRRARKKLGKSYVGFAESLKRDRRRRVFRTFTTRLISILVCGMTVYAVTPIFTGWYAYRRFMAEPDITGDCMNNDVGTVQCTVDTEPHKIRKGSHVVDSTTDQVWFGFGCGFYTMDNVITEVDLEALKDIPGIRAVEMDTLDCSHYLAWDSWQEDRFVSYCAEKAIHNPEFNSKVKLVSDGPHYDSMLAAVKTTFSRIFCYGESEGIWNKAKKYLDPEVMDHEAFIRGEQIILVVDETGESVIRPGEDDDHVGGGDLLAEYPLSIKPGDIVWFERIGSMNEKHRVGAVVAGLIPKSKLELKFGDEDITEGEDPMILFSAVGSPTLARRIMEAEGREYGGNYVKVYLSSVGRNEKVAGYIVNTFINNNMSYSNNCENAQTELNYSIEKTFTNGPFALMLVILWLFVVVSLAGAERFELAPRVRELIRIGAAPSVVGRQKSMDAAVQSMWTLWTIPVYSIIALVRHFIYDWRFTLKQSNVIIVPGQYSANLQSAWEFFKNWIGARQTLQVQAYSYHSVIQITVIVALLFWLILFLVNRKLDISDQDCIEDERIN